jgi:hypothetical protein
LVGLVKHRMSAHGGRASVSALASATAQQEGTVRTGLAWLAARGYVVVEGAGDDGGDGDDEVRLISGGAAPDQNAALLAEARLKAALAETAAYRAYLRRVKADVWVR